MYKRKDIIKRILLSQQQAGETAGENTETILCNLLSSGSDITNGFIFESITELLIVCKCIPSLSYTKIKDGIYPNGHDVLDCKNIFNKNITDKSGGCSDITFEHEGILYPVSCKFYNGFDSKNYDIVIIKDMSTNSIVPLVYKICLFVKDKQVVLNHKYTNYRSSHKI